MGKSQFFSLRVSTLLLSDGYDDDSKRFSIHKDKHK